jgi:hypothetical protein
VYVLLDLSIASVTVYGQIRISGLVMHI